MNFKKPLNVVNFIYRSIIVAKAEMFFNDYLWWSIKYLESFKYKTEELPDNNPGLRSMNFNFSNNMLV